MKRIDQTPNRETLVNLIKNDRLGRNEDLNDFASILSSIEGGLCIFLDGQWGVGKTFFVKQLKCLLEEINPNLESDNDLNELLKENGALCAFLELDSFLPIYYNAWENDHWSDPLPSIAATIALQSDGSEAFTEKTPTREVIGEIFDGCLGILGSNLNLSGAIQAVSGQDLIKHYKSRNALRRAVADLVNNVLAEKANTLLLIVDELDRCRPEFALETLEQLKNLFDDDRVIIVYSINEMSLSSVVEGVYSKDIDGSKYLSRFYDLKIPLREVDGSKYLTACSFDKTEYRFDVIAHEMTRVYKMSMRDINRYFSELTRVRPFIVDQKRSPNDFIRIFADAGLVPIVLAIRLMTPTVYYQITHHWNSELLLDCILRGKESIDFLDETWGACDNFEKPHSEYQSDAKVAEIVDANRQELLQALVYRIWCKENDNSDLRHAQDILGTSWGFDTLSNLSKII